jgi:hypothetical protein
MRSHGEINLGQNKQRNHNKLQGRHFIEHPIRKGQNRGWNYGPKGTNQVVEANNPVEEMHKQRKAAWKAE